MRQATPSAAGLTRSVGWGRGARQAQSLPAPCVATDAHHPSHPCACRSPCAAQPAAGGHRRGATCTAPPSSPSWWPSWCCPQRCGCGDRKLASWQARPGPDCVQLAVTLLAARLPFPCTFTVCWTCVFSIHTAGHAGRQALCLRQPSGVPGQQPAQLPAARGHPRQVGATRAACICWFQQAGEGTGTASGSWLSLRQVTGPFQVFMPYARPHPAQR